MTSLYERINQQVPAGCPLVCALTGFLDAGNAGELAAEQLLADLSHQTVAVFDTEELVDYRARRPAATFERDRYTAIELPELVVHLMTDTQDAPFLLMCGPEPDLRWRGFVTATADLLCELDVHTAIGLHGIPMTTPHTRPLGITEHGSDPALLAGRPSWVDKVRIPGSAAALLEFDLPSHGIATAGFSVHVPHYLADTEFPAASVALIDALAVAAGLSLPVPDLRSRADAQLREINAAVADSPDNSRAIAELETAYDQAITTAGEHAEAGQPPFTGRVPDGDELAAELERFLRSHQ